MRPIHAAILLIGVLLASGGYGATFLFSMHVRAIGGTDFDTGVALAGAALGTFAGVSLTGWVAQHVGAARMAALAALCVGAGVVGFALMAHASGIDALPGFLVGLGWGAFCLAAPMALAERTSDADRSLWFLRFATFQMAGVGGCPALAAFAMRFWRMPLEGVLYAIGALCLIGALTLEIFGRLARVQPAQERWLRSIGAIARTRAVYPIVIIALGGCVFSGLMTFQMSLVQGTQAKASTFFSLYTITVIATRWLLARLVVRMRAATATKVLLAMMVLGSAAMFAVPYHAGFQALAAVLLGTGYGLAYPIVQVQAIDDAAAAHRRAALTWFVAAYFIGAFGFPSLGGWVLVHSGKGALLALIAGCGLAALALAILRDRRRGGSLSASA
ncbi:MULTISPECIES: MFS transporter [Paraburkholderia]|uniref:Major Facilitator Superfamily protein n=1 Tax=Paraburkholderia tropica TaxID=92647 RepID=A0A1A5X5L3_9BURK|nr:MFS transporter [Paraburkholderia tropica]MBB2983518.1 MFS family permease [Paraburkholderia tropica]OBR48435.1 MFS transporter [Paraburkholderia tropica]QNB17071.1 MFS transporter [Paraburkholderia tropica]RQN38096.1 MFS transporter [Paraburkholderia tropica]SEJ98381.1 Major Facilitator Superfamily protein [Paraburkholderia tropica]